jgi:ABC-2 type transport system ATP-binding protein
MLGAIFGLDDDRTRRRVAELGELLDATDQFDQPVRTQSLGQRMRCELAASMLHEPEMLFLDEPTVGLDLLGKQRFRELLVRLNEQVGTTVLITSHDVSDVEHVANRAIVVNHGSIIYDAAVATMRRELLATKRVEVGLEHAVDLAQLGAVIGSGVTFASPSEFVVSLDVDTSTRAIRDVLDTVLSSLPVADLSVVDPPLEQVIAEIYRRPS